jgi:hypothetical protein
MALTQCKCNSSSTFEVLINLLRHLQAFFVTHVESKQLNRAGCTIEYLKFVCVYLLVKVSEKVQMQVSPTFRTNLVLLQLISPSCIFCAHVPKGKNARRKLEQFGD